MRYLPYADGSFEVVIAANVLHLLPEPDKALDEAARVLAPGACSSCRRLRMRGRAGLQGCAFG